MSKIISNWNPEDSHFWQTQGKKVARRNLIFSVFALLLGFSVWQIWSIVATQLPGIGFQFTVNQLFWLTSLPVLTGATLRLFFTIAPSLFGGARWTVICSILLLIPTIGLGIALQDKNTSYSTFLILAALCGLGGGCFSSSMANISYFYPNAQKGNALGINAGIGNLGVSVAQFLIPLAITVGLFAGLTGEAQVFSNDSGNKMVWLQNAAFVWVPLIILATLCAFFFMNNLAVAKVSIQDQLKVTKLKHTWLVCLLYTGTFGSFIGLAAGFALLGKELFPQSNVIQYAFLGPLLGSLARVFGGWLSDKIPASKITHYSFILMMVFVVMIIFTLPSESSSGSFSLFFTSFMCLFVLTGISNGSTSAQVPVIFTKLRLRGIDSGAADLIKQAKISATREAATVVGFMGAVAAFGGFFIPKSFGTSIELTGSPIAALIFFIIFYMICFTVNWWYYVRKNSEIAR